MTKTEQLAAKVQREKEAMDKHRLALAQSEASLREETRKATHKRRYEVGALAEAAGLCAWSNAELSDGFAALVKLREGESPGAVLEEILGHPGPRTGGENGVAESATRVSAAH